MLTLWKAFTAGADGHFSGIGAEEKPQIQYSGKNAVTPVAEMSLDRPRVIYLSGMYSFTNEVCNPGDAGKVLSYLAHGGVHADDIDFYMPTYSKTSGSSICYDRLNSYAEYPKDYISPESAELSLMIFPEKVMPDLQNCGISDRERIVNELVLLASRTTLMGYSSGPVYIESMFNDLTSRLHLHHFTDAETNRITSSLLSFHVAPTQKFVDKEHNLPQVNIVTLDDTSMGASYSNYRNLLDVNQHPVLLDSMAYPGVLIFGTKELPPVTSIYRSQSKQDNQSQTYSSPLFYGRDKKTIPNVAHVTIREDKKHKNHHRFSLFTTSTRLMKDETSESVAYIHTFGFNPAADLFLHGLAKGIKASIQSADQHTPRDAQALVKEVQSELTPAGKNQLIIQTLRDQAKGIFFDDFSQAQLSLTKGKIRYGKILRPELFKDRMHQMEEHEREFFERFDEKKACVLAGEESLEHFMQWTELSIHNRKKHGAGTVSFL